MASYYSPQCPYCLKPFLTQHRVSSHIGALAKACHDAWTQALTAADIIPTVSSEVFADVGAGYDNNFGADVFFLVEELAFSKYAHVMDMNGMDMPESLSSTTAISSV